MNVLITGGAGFIGSHIQDSMLNKQHNTIIVDDLSTGHRRNLNPKSVFHEIDIRTDTMRDVFDTHHPEIVFHLAAQMDVRRSVKEPTYDADVNIVGSIKLMELCREFGTKRIIYASTGGAIYGEPDYMPADEKHPVSPMCQYGISKHTVEHYLELYHKNYDLSYLALRFPNVYGPRQDPHGEAGVVAIFSLLMLRGKQVTIFGDGSKTRDYVYIGDIIKACEIGVETDTVGVYNLGWGTEVKDFEIYDSVRRHTESDLPPIYAPRRLGEVERICLDATRARDVLGWEPTVTLDDGIKSAVSFYRDKLDEFTI